ncbi:MAG: prolipoprotein diacylglyceryl transferase [Gammaproteobacteria bacterium]|nr:prolipoprotein diacylglyceryl transferase [Gammaproteobacteria bacterium]
MHWNADPIMIQFGSFAIRWYGVLFAAAFLSGIYIMRKIYQREGHKTDKLDDLLIYMMVGTIIGARLGHVLFYEPGYYFSHPLAILKIWEGGLASHGGTVGILAAVYLYSRKYSEGGFLWLMDRLSLPIALGAAFIRLGNFFNSEIVGTPTSLPWGIIFERIGPDPRHPVQLYESITYLTTFVVLVMAYRRFSGKWKDGALFGLLLTVIFGARILLEFVKTRQAAYGHDFWLSVGQWLSIPFVILGIFLMVRAFRTQQS